MSGSELLQPALKIISSFYNPVSLLPKCSKFSFFELPLSLNYVKLHSLIACGSLRKPPPISKSTNLSTHSGLLASGISNVEVLRIICST